METLRLRMEIVMVVSQYVVSGLVVLQWLEKQPLVACRFGIGDGQTMKYALTCLE